MIEGLESDECCVLIQSSDKRFKIEVTPYISMLGLVLNYRIKHGMNYLTNKQRMIFTFKSIDETEEFIKLKLKDLK